VPLFPPELQAIAIACFYAVGTAIGGVSGPVSFGPLIRTGSAQHVVYGSLVGGRAMAGSAVGEWRLGIQAEQRPLEGIAEPLSAVADAPEPAGQPSA